MVLDFKVNARLVVAMTINFLCAYADIAIRVFEFFYVK